MSPSARSGLTTGTAFWKRSGCWKRIPSTPGSSASETNHPTPSCHRAVNVDFVGEVALVVTTDTVRGEAIIATARYIVREAPNTERSAEVAFVVEEDYHGRGIASRLLAHLAALARGQNLKRFEADVLSQNSPMLAVFKRCGFPMRQRRDGGIVHLTLELAANDSSAS